MLVGLAGLLSGYDGSFEFKSGEQYPDTVPYVAMRVMMAMFGVAMVPLGWYTAVELGMSWRACHLVALMILLGEHIYYLQRACSTNICRCRLVMYLSFHPTRLYAFVLHVHYGFLPDKIPQPTISVRRRSTEALHSTDIHQVIFV